MKSINLPQYVIWLLIACVLFAGWFFFPGLGQELALAAHHSHRSRVHATDFPKGAQWLNVSRPLALEDLKGKVVPDGKERGYLMDARLPLEIPYTRQNNGVGHFTVDLTLYYCRKDNKGTCHIKDLQWRPEVRTDGPETKRARLAYAVPRP